MRVRLSRGRRLVSEVFAFRWSVPAEGFRWADVPERIGVEGLDAAPSSQAAGTSAGPWLVPTYEDSDWYPYEPMKVKALFRGFADLYPTSEPSVLKFARQYGALGFDTQMPRDVVALGEEPPRFNVLIDSEGDEELVPALAKPAVRTQRSGSGANRWRYGSARSAP